MKSLKKALLKVSEINAANTGDNKFVTTSGGGVTAANIDDQSTSVAREASASVPEGTPRQQTPTIDAASHPSAPATVPQKGPALPPGVILRKGPIPPGAKLVVPPGNVANRLSQASAMEYNPELSGSTGMKSVMSSNAVHVKMPPGPVKMAPGFLSGVKVMVGPPPPGAKAMVGAPPPGAQPMKVPVGFPTKAVSPSVTSRESSMSRPQFVPAPLSPPMKLVGPPPPGAKIIMGPPPTGVLRKTPVQSPPRVGSLSPPLRPISPNQVNAMVLQIPAIDSSRVQSPHLIPSSPQLYPTTPHSVKSISFHSLPSQASGASVREKSSAGIQTRVETTEENKAAGATAKKVSSDSSLNVPSILPARLVSTRNGDDDHEVHRGKDGHSTSSSDNMFYEEDTLEASPAEGTVPPHPSTSGSPVKNEKTHRMPNPPLFSRFGTSRGSSGSISMREIDDETASPTSPGRESREGSLQGRGHHEKEGGATLSSTKRGNDAKPHAQRKSPQTVEALREKVDGWNEEMSSKPIPSTGPASPQNDGATDQTDTAQGGQRRTLFRLARSKSLTAEYRTRIAEQFLSILCQQQYYGKVKKIHSIRRIRAERSEAPGLQGNNTIYVATKGHVPSEHFYPQLRLHEEDGMVAKDSKDPGALDTPIVLYEAAPGNMLFADTELDANRLLESSETATSCFVLSCSAIMFKKSHESVLPLALLKVRWTPYASSASEPHCPLHKKELQLFDPFSKDLVCALCTQGKDERDTRRLVVIPDVLVGESRQKIHESIARHLSEAQRNTKMWVGQHQRICRLADTKKKAIHQQFDLLVSAIQSKREEFLEACSAEFGYAMSDVAREILVADEKVQLLSASADHLRGDASKSLYSMQIATIAQGLDAPHTFPSSFTRSSLRVPGLASGVTPNLESVMAELQNLTPVNYQPSRTVLPAEQKRTATAPPTRFRSRSPSTSDPREGIHCTEPRERRRPSRSVTIQSKGGGDLNPRQQHVPHEASLRNSQRRAASAQNYRRPSPLRSRDGSPRRSATTHTSASRKEGTPGANRKGGNDSRRAYNTYETRQMATRSSHAAHSVDVNCVPNSTGTYLFEYPMHALLQGGADIGKRGVLRPNCVQWAFLVTDPGDWVGIGVGVGTNIDSWIHGRSNDLSHLWIVPYAGIHQTFLLRVTHNPCVGRAKLSIHDVKGKQLDDGSIPQWSGSRVCYPQVTFGGRVGQWKKTYEPRVYLMSTALDALGPLAQFLPHRSFTKVQELSIPALVHNDKNVLVAAPTGSGKTLLLEVAMLRLFREHLLPPSDSTLQTRQGRNAWQASHSKAVYVCPIKALAYEKYTEWTSTYPTLSVSIETGDEEWGGRGETERVASIAASMVIITTPERWDSITRRWNEAAILGIVGSVDLLLLDEVHTVHEERGAALEALVNRMKVIKDVVAGGSGSLGAKTPEALRRRGARFVAVSGTLPNVEDFALWLQVPPSGVFSFSAADRPVPLTIEVRGFPNDSHNPYAFDRFLSFKLFSIVRQYSSGRPSIIFCASRKEAVTSALRLVADIHEAAAREHHEQKLQPSAEVQRLAAQANEKQLRTCLLVGMAFHHAAMPVSDRRLVERMFRDQFIAVLCTTTTLALGVNLPAHLVVIKGTTFFKSGQREDLPLSEVAQMCGRAGRPGLDDHGFAVVLTTQRKAPMYQAVRSGDALTTIESQLHRHMIEHVNAEVALRTIHSYASAVEWVKKTFFWIRLQRCPQHYGLQFGSMEEQEAFKPDVFAESLMGRMLAALCHEGCLTVRSSTGTVTTVDGDEAVQSLLSLDHPTTENVHVQRNLRLDMFALLESTRIGRSMSRLYVLFSTVQLCNRELCTGLRGKDKRPEEIDAPPDGTTSLRQVYHCSESDAPAAASPTTRNELSTNPSKDCRGRMKSVELQPLLSLLSRCGEFSELRLRQGDRGPLNELNKSVRYPLSSGKKGGREVREDWHKVYLLIQAQISQLAVSDFSLRNDSIRLWSSVPRLSRFLLEYASSLQSYSLLLRANVLLRCVEQRMWHNGLVVKQLDGVTDTIAKALALAGFHQFRSVLEVSPRKLEAVCNRLPPYGTQLQDQIRAIPRCSVRLTQATRPMAHTPTTAGANSGEKKLLVEISPETTQLCSSPRTSPDEAERAVSSSLQPVKCRSGTTFLLLVGNCRTDDIYLSRHIPYERLGTHGCSNTPCGHARSTNPVPHPLYFEIALPSGVVTEDVEARLMHEHFLGNDVVVSLESQSHAVSVSAMTEATAQCGTAEAGVMCVPPTVKGTEPSPLMQLKRCSAPITTAATAEEKVRSGESPGGKRQFDAFLEDLKWISESAPSPKCEPTRAGGLANTVGVAKDSPQDAQAVESSIWDVDVVKDTPLTPLVEATHDVTTTTDRPSSLQQLVDTTKAHPNCAEHEGNDALWSPSMHCPKARRLEEELADTPVPNNEHNDNTRMAFPRTRNVFLPRCLSPEPVYELTQRNRNIARTATCRETAIRSGDAFPTGSYPIRYAHNPQVARSMHHVHSPHASASRFGVADSPWWSTETVDERHTFTPAQPKPLLRAMPAQMPFAHLLHTHSTIPDPFQEGGRYPSAAAPCRNGPFLTTETPLAHSPQWLCDERLRLYARDTLQPVLCGSRGYGQIPVPTPYTDVPHSIAGQNCSSTSYALSSGMGIHMQRGQPNNVVANHAVPFSTWGGIGIAAMPPPGQCSFSEFQARAAYGSVYALPTTRGEYFSAPSAHEQYTVPQQRNLRVAYRNPNVYKCSGHPPPPPNRKGFGVSWW